jgi:hypothetical protein
MTKITILLDKSTNKIIPFVYGDYGEIIVTSVDPNVKDENLIVSLVDAAYVDWEDMRLLAQPKKEFMESHPFNLFYILKDC